MEEGLGDKRLKRKYSSYSDHGHSSQEGRCLFDAFKQKNPLELLLPPRIKGRSWVLPIDLAPAIKILAAVGLLEAEELTQGKREGAYHSAPRGMCSR